MGVGDVEVVYCELVDLVDWIEGGIFDVFY